MWKLVTFFALGLLSLCVETATAQNTNPPQPGAEEAQRVIDGCWAISQEDRESGVTVTMANGTYRTIKCMERAVLDLTEPMFDPNDVPREKISGWLDELGALRAFYSALYEKNISCVSHCGTIQLTRYAIPHAQLLESMIRDILATREDDDYKTRVENAKKRSNIK